MNHLYTCVKKTQTYHTLVAVASQKTRHTSTATSTFEARAPSPARTCSLAPTRQEAPCRAFPPPSPAPWAAHGARARAGSRKGGRCGPERRCSKTEATPDPRKVWEEDRFGTHHEDFGAHRVQSVWDHFRTHDEEQIETQKSIRKASLFGSTQLW